MRFCLKGEWHSVSRITGPTYNYLGVKFGADSQNLRPIVEAMRSELGDATVLPDDVERQVVLGISQANKKFGTEYRAIGIRYVPTDSPSPEVYRLRAAMLVERLANGAEFDIVG